MQAAAALAEYAAGRRRWLADQAQERPIAVPVLALPPMAGPVPTIQAVRLLETCGVPMAPVAFAAHVEEAASAGEQFGFPVVLKIESPDLPHKTEVDGVRLNLRDAAQLRDAFDTMLADVRRAAPDARISGAIVQPMLGGGIEMVVGLRHDPIFGVVIMVGLGGIFVEILRDVSFRLAPVSLAEAGRMLNELHGSAILRGVRGRPAADLDALTHLVHAVSIFGAALGDRLVELDLNPVLAGPDRAVAVDVLLTLASSSLASHHKQEPA